MALTTLAVTRLGRAARDLLAGGGAVHSVFHKAVNLTANDDKGDRLLTLLSADAHEYGLTCPGLPDVAARFQPGQRFVRTEGGLFFPAAALALDFGRAEVWAQPAPVRAAGAEEWRERLAALRRLLDEDPPPDHGGVLARLRALSEARPHGPPPPLAERLAGLAPLVGLGPGLTPLGDDYISGYLLAAFGPGQADRALLAVGADRLAGGDTTVFSKIQIRLAGRGLCLASIAAAMQSLATANFDPGLIRPVLEIGATSGHGWLLGIIRAAGDFGYFDNPHNL